MEERLEPDDAQLLSRVAAGDRAAFGLLHDGLAPLILLRLRRRCTDEEIVADVLQDTFVTVWRCAAGFRGDGEVAAWVWTIASRRLIDAFRRRAARGEVIPVARVPETGSAASAEDVALAASPDVVATQLGRLSPQLRAVIQALVLDELTVRETAVLLGIPPGTVKTRARRARLQLREGFE